MSASGEDGGKHLCGVGPIRPGFLQKLVDVRTVVVALCTLDFINSFIQFGYFNGVVTSIEKQLGISSSRSGLIKSSKDIAELCVVLLISYFGAKGNRMVLTGVATCLAGVGFIMVSMPHYLMDPYRITAELADGNQTTGLCRVQNVTSPIDPGNTCGNADSGRENPLIYFLFVGMGLSGLLPSALYTIGLSYMDDHASTNSAPLYMGIINAIGAVAAALGFLLSSVFLGWYVDFDKVVPESVVISSADPRWLGAWWLGFLIAGVFAIVVSVFFSCFPKSFPNSSTGKDEGKQNRNDSNHKNGDHNHGIRDKNEVDLNDTTDQSGVEDRDTKAKNMDIERKNDAYGVFTGFFVQSKSLLKNPVFMFEIGASIFYISNLNGLALFLPKVMEVNFGISSAQASLMAGALVIPGSMIGYLASGATVKKFKLSLMACIKFAIAASTAGAIAGLTLIATLCEGHEVGRSLGSCGASCACSENDFNLVCGADSRTYYSACAAGCSAVNATETVALRNYTGCACLDEGSWASQGPCQWSCGGGFQFPLFIIAALGVAFFSGFMTPFTYQVYIRQVKQDEKSLAFGMRHVVQRLLASFPAPVYFGAVVDSACVLWERECGQRKSCWVYSNRNLMFRLMGLSVGLKLAEIVFHVLAWLAMRYKINAGSSKNTAGDRSGVANEGFDSTQL